MVVAGLLLLWPGVLLRWSFLMLGLVPAVHARATARPSPNRCRGTAPAAHREHTAPRARPFHQRRRYLYASPVGLCQSAVQHGPYRDGMRSRPSPNERVVLSPARCMVVPRAPALIPHATCKAPLGRHNNNREAPECIVSIEIRESLCAVDRRGDRCGP